MLGKLFVSYRADDESTKYKNLLVAWSESPNLNFFEVKFEDTSIGVSINSEDANYIKRRIREKLENSSRVICLIGKSTHQSEWVRWEIEKAFELNIPITAIKINSAYTTPYVLYNKNVSWAYSFKYESIKNALLYS